MKRSLSIIILMILFSNLAFSHISFRPLNELGEVADAMDIDGGRMQQLYKKPHQIWANISIVLDCPFNDGLEWDELTAQNPYSLKEASLPTYNEAHINYVCATIFDYYFSNAHKLTKISQDRLAKVHFHVYRNSSAPIQIEKIKELIVTCFPSFLRDSYDEDRLISEEKQVEVIFSYGVPLLRSGFEKLFQEEGIHFSFSLVAGLHDQLESGMVLLPYSHTPFSLSNLIYDKKKTYFVDNHLINAIDKLLDNQSEEVREMINHSFLSENPDKNMLKAKRLSRSDLLPAKLLEIDGMFNPSNLPDAFLEVSGY